MFLDIKPFPEEKLHAKEREYSNWIKVAEAIYGTENLVQVLRILQLELMGMRRQYVIERVYSRFSALRAQDEKKHMREFLEDKDPLWGDKKEIKQALKNWHNMYKYLQKKSHTTAHLKCLLYEEFYGKRRPYMMKRLYGKFSMSRMREEKKEMLQWKLKNK